MKRLMRIVAALTCVLSLSGTAVAQDELVTELAQHHVDITAQFTGEKVLIFGAVSHPGDIVIKVSSPIEKEAISHKAKYGPFWLTSGKFTVDGAPGLLFLLSTRPIGELLSPAERERYGLSLKSSLSGAQPVGVSADVPDWRSSFLRLKQKADHYLEQGHAVNMVERQAVFRQYHLARQVAIGRIHDDDLPGTGRQGGRPGKSISRCTGSTGGTLGFGGRLQPFVAVRDRVHVARHDPGIGPGYRPAQRRRRLSRAWAQSHLRIDRGSLFVDTESDVARFAQAINSLRRTCRRRLFRRGQGRP